MNKLILLISLVLSSQISANVLYKSPVLKLSINATDDEIIIKFSDTVMHPLAAELRDSKKFLDKSKTLVLELDSGGGDREEGKKVIAFFEKLKIDGYQYKTRVLNGRMCASMCVPIFMSADTREAGEVATFMFHAVHGPLNNLPKVEKTEAMFNAMVGRGMNPSFIEYLKQKEALSVPGEYWLSALELNQLESNVITNLLSRHVLIKPKRVPFIPKL